MSHEQATGIDQGSLCLCINLNSIKDLASVYKGSLTGTDMYHEKSQQVRSKGCDVLCWGVRVCTDYSTQAPDTILQSVHCSPEPQEFQMAQCVWCAWVSYIHNRAQVASPRKSGCCGNGTQCERGQARIEGHRCRRLRRTLGHADKPLHKPLCSVLNWMGPDRLQGRLYHRTYNGCSLGREELIGGRERKKNHHQWRTSFYT